jgi:hypothetical protein
MKDVSDNMIEQAIERIKKMEELFELVSSGGDTEETRLARETLSGYMESGDFMRDYELDEEGLLPAELKRGVLSQDGLYDLLEE